MLRLDLSVSSLEGEALLPAGTDLTAAALESVTARGRARTWPQAPLLAHGSVRTDLAAYARKGFYRTVFDEGEALRDLETLMASVTLPAPCLRGLDFFRAHDAYTYRHILMVFALSCLLARKMGRGGTEAASEVMAGHLHDFGKLCIPVPVLRKRTALARAERALLEQHTLAGHVLLRYYFACDENFMTRVARDHHERRDGSGYPRGIRLADPLVEIVAACDVYDALVSPRPYRVETYDNRTALEEITRLAEEGRISWEIVQLLVAQSRRDKPAPERCVVSREKRGTPPAGNLYGVYED